MTHYCGWCPFCKLYNLLHVDNCSQVPPTSLACLVLTMGRALCFMHVCCNPFGRIMLAHPGCCQCHIVNHTPVLLAAAESAGTFADSWYCCMCGRSTVKAAQQLQSVNQLPDLILQLHAWWFECVKQLLTYDAFEDTMMNKQAHCMHGDSHGIL